MSDLLSLPRAGQYACILADPPWRFETHSGPSVPQRAGEQHYSTMSHVDLAKLPVRNIAARDAVLLMWIVDANLEQALMVGKEWGFTFKTVAFFWSKMSKGGMPYVGLGYWTRSGGETCLLFTRGAPKRLHKDVRQVILSPVREHSRKPEGIYQRTERLVAGPYLELFARQTRPGWDAWGDQADKFGEAA